MTLPVCSCVCDILDWTQPPLQSLTELKARQFKFFPRERESQSQVPVVPDFTARWRRPL